MESSCQCCCVKDELWWRFHCDRHAECPLTPAQMSAFALHATHSWVCSLQSYYEFPAKALYTDTRWSWCLYLIEQRSRQRGLMSWQTSSNYGQDLSMKKPNAAMQQNGVPCQLMFIIMHLATCTDTVTPMTVLCDSFVHYQTAISVLALALSHWILTLMLCFMMLCSWPFCKCSVNVVCPCTLSRSKGIILHHWQRLHRTFCAQRLLESLFDLPTQHLHAAPNIGC